MTAPADGQPAGGQNDVQGFRVRGFKINAPHPFLIKPPGVRAWAASHSHTIFFGYFIFSTKSHIYRSFLGFIGLQQDFETVLEQEMTVNNKQAYFASKCA
jgi:hypothetical protein